MSVSSPCPIPSPERTDDPDVAWALETAAAHWRSGALADALVWLRRAVDAAVAAGLSQRATDLNRRAVHYSDAMRQGKPPVPSSLPPPRLAPPSIPVVTDSEADEVDALLRQGDSVVDVGDDDLVIESEPTAPSATVPTLDHLAELDDLLDFDSELPTGNQRSDAPVPTLGQRESVGHGHDEGGVSAGRSVPPWSAPPSLDPGPPSEPTVPSALPLPPREETSKRTAPLVALSLTEAAGYAPSAPTGSARIELLSLHDSDHPVIPWERCVGLSDLTEESWKLLGERAVSATLQLDEELSKFAAVLVTRGSIVLSPLVSDVVAARLGVDQVVFAHGTIAIPMELRVIAAEDDTNVIFWDEQTFAEALEGCPWVEDDLRRAADRFQALAGVSLGPLGERLDEELRGQILGRCETRTALPGEVIVERGAQLGALLVVGVGTVIAEGRVHRAGDLIAPQAALSPFPAASAIVAGDVGAIVLTASRHVTHELMMSMPPLLELMCS